MDENIKRSIILENYQNPINRGLIEDDSYLRENTNSDSCIDEIELMIKFNDDGIIEDIKFDGEACAICTSSTSLMINSLIGKNIKEVMNLYNNFSNMIEEKEYNVDALEELVVYDEIYKQPNRKKCALLPWWGIKKIIEKYEKGSK